MRQSIFRTAMNRKAEELSIPGNIIAQKYLETIGYVTETWRSLPNHLTRAK